MNVKVYLKNKDGDYVYLDLFKDEKININLNVKNLSNISKIRSDFTQSFTIPCSPANNKLFEYWYNADVDGTFNANLRVDAYLEVNDIPFRYGSIQLDNCKLKMGLPYCYTITFYGLAINLSDKFSDDEFRVLNLDALTHTYTQNRVKTAMGNTTIAGGDIYYPLINYRTFMVYGGNSNIDLKHNGNTLTYRDFKPAVREIRLIEAIEQKYNVTFSRDFFDRAIFYNRFMACHKELGQMKTSSTALLVNYNNFVSGLETPPLVWDDVPDPYNFTTNEIFVRWAYFPDGFPNNNKRITVKLVVSTTSSNAYKVEVFSNGVVIEEFTNLQNSQTLTIFNKTYDEDSSDKNLTIKISSIESTFTFSTLCEISYKPNSGGSARRIITIGSPNQTTANALVKIAEQLPELKIKDYFNSLIAQFNLVIIPKGQDNYYIDTLDNWYSKGNAYDISGLIDIEDITVKKPSIKKRIDFLYQKTDSILGKKYFENTQQSYGDLKATYDVVGEELKIETQFENLKFERLVNSITGVISDLNAGYFVDLNNNPIKGKAFCFYRNGIETSDNIHINNTSVEPVFHTATEDNKRIEQVTNSINFGADNSTYFYSPIDTSLYFNFWKTYIEELYNKKTRVLQIKCKLPIRILHSLQMNDRFVIGEYKYKISTVKVDLTNADAEVEVFSDLGQPIDSVNNIIPLTVDSTEYTADNDILKVDTISTYNPVTSYTIPAVSITEYNGTNGEEIFEVKVDTWDNWEVINTNSWIFVNKMSGRRSDYLRVKIIENPTTTRTGTIDVITAGETFTITINQL